MKNQIVFALTGALLMLASGTAKASSEVGYSGGAKAGAEQASGTYFKITNLKTGACGKFTNGEFAGAADTSACAGKMIKTGIVDEIHKRSHLGLTPRYSTAFAYPPDTESILFREGKKAEYYTSQKATPNNGCVLNLSEEAKRAGKLSPQMTIVLRKPRANTQEYKFIPDFIKPDIRWWIATSEASGKVVGSLSCDQDVANKRSSLERHLSRYWDVFEIQDDGEDGLGGPIDDGGMI